MLFDLTHCEYSSGSSTQGKQRRSRCGDARLRVALMMPTFHGSRHNPLIRAFTQRLLDKGKLKMQMVDSFHV